MGILWELNELLQTVSIQGLSYKVIESKWGIVPSEPGKTPRMCKPYYYLGWKYSWAVDSGDALIWPVKQCPCMILWRVRIAMFACWTQTPVYWLWAKQPQPEWRVESRTENPGMSLPTGRGPAIRSPSHALQRGASSGPLVYDHPPRTCHYSSSKRCKKRSQHLESRLEKPCFFGNGPQMT